MGHMVPTCLQEARQHACLYTGREGDGEGGKGPRTELGPRGQRGINKGVTVGASEPVEARASVSI